MSAPRAVAGRLYQDEHGGFWVGGEDGRYWQTNALGTCAVPYYVHHFIDAEAAAKNSPSPLATAVSERQM